MPDAVLAPLFIGLGLAVPVGAPLLMMTSSTMSDSRGGLNWSFASDRPMLLTLSIALGACLVVAAWGVARWLRFSGTPRVPAPVSVVAKRARDAGRSGMSFYMTFETESGQRTEGRITVDDFGSVMAGDVGVAWFQDGRFVGFRKVDIEASAA